MPEQPIEKMINESLSESPSHETEVVRFLRCNIVVIQNIVLTLARVLFSVVLLNSMINWNDVQWTITHGLAIIPLVWAALATILMLAGQFRWKTGGRVMAITDMVVAASVIVFFPAYSLSALALAILSATFLVLRHAGRFVSLLSLLPLSAMLVRPLGILKILGFYIPVSYVNIGLAGEIVAFLLSSFAVLISILIIIHIRMIGRPLTFQQPWEEEFGLKVGKNSITPVIDCIQRLYPGNKLVCILDEPNRWKVRSIITNSSVSGSDIETLRSQLTDYADHGSRPVIVELDNCVQIDIESGQQSPISTSFEKMGRGLTGLGFNNGVLFDFKLGDIRGRLFFTTIGPIEEALRNDMILLGVQLVQFCGHATKWEERRKAMMAMTRDLARRDLHDGVLQSLAALKMRLVTIISYPDFLSNPHIEALRKTVDFVTVEQTRLRALLHNDEGEDDVVNLVDALEVCLKTLSLQWEVSVKLESQEPALSVDRGSAENIEYLAREAIANAIRHAEAKHLTLTMALTNGDFMLTLKDDRNASAGTIGGEQAARMILKSRSLTQRIALVNGHAYTKDLDDSTLLVISIPLDFIEND